MNIRNYTPADFQEIKSWWLAAGEPAPSEGMMPPETTFIIEVDGQPVACQSLLLTNTKEISYLEFLAANPKFKSPERKQITAHLLDYLVSVAKHLGYKRVLTLSYKPKLKQHFIDFYKLTPTIENVCAYVRET